MEGEVANTHRTDKRRFRVIRFVRPRQSYAGHLTRRSTPIVTDEEALRESEVALLLHALAKRVTPQQMEIIRLRTKGYQTNEIAQMQNTSLYHVNTLLDLSLIHISFPAGRLGLYPQRPGRHQQGERGRYPHCNLGIGECQMCIRDRYRYVPAEMSDRP